MSRPIEPEASIPGQGRRAFLRGFLALQAAFLPILLIASINEPTSPYNRVTAATQMAMVGGLWVLSDAVLLAVHALRVRGHRPHP